MIEKSASTLNILVIDDNPFDQLIISKSLEGVDASIQLASSANEAKSLIALNLFDLIICDISMPEVSGFDFIRILKKDEHFKEIPVVFFSGKKETDELAQEAYDIGALDIISKERSPVKLKGRFTALIKQIEAQKQLQQENKTLNQDLKTDGELLLKVIPEHALSRLRSDDNKNKLHKNATVMFSDFSGFTRLSRKRSAKFIIEKLNGYFCEFDLIVEKFHIEKIKTIGDSYMCAAGVPSDRADHLFMMLLASLEIRQFVNNKAEEDLGVGIEPWFVKFGIASGEVISGIIGSTKLMFDIWGDTVNVASRLEGLAEKNCILISEKTNSTIKNLFDTEPLGVKTLRNWGELKVFNVVGIKNEYSASAHCQSPNLLFYREMNKIIQD